MFPSADVSKEQERYRLKFIGSFENTPFKTMGLCPILWNPLKRVYLNFIENHFNKWFSGLIINTFPKLHFSLLKFYIVYDKVKRYYKIAYTFVLSVFCDYKSQSFIFISIISMYIRKLCPYIFRLYKKSPGLKSEWFRFFMLYSNWL